MSPSKSMVSGRGKRAGSSVFHERLGQQHRGRRGGHWLELREVRDQEGVPAVREWGTNPQSQIRTGSRRPRHGKAAASYFVKCWFSI